MEDIKLPARRAGYHSSGWGRVPIDHDECQEVGGQQLLRLSIFLFESTRELVRGSVGSGGGKAQPTDLREGHRSHPPIAQRLNFHRMSLSHYTPTKQRTFNINYQ